MRLSDCFCPTGFKKNSIDGNIYIPPFREVASLLLMVVNNTATDGQQRCACRRGINALTWYKAGNFGCFVILSHATGNKHYLQGTGILTVSVIEPVSWVMFTSPMAPEEVIFNKRGSGMHGVSTLPTICPWMAVPRTVPSTSTVIPVGKHNHKKQAIEWTLWEYLLFKAHFNNYHP